MKVSPMPRPAVRTGIAAMAAVLALNGCAIFKHKPGEGASDEAVKAHAPLAPVAYPLYRVKAGDTLYAISLHFDKDYRELAKLNNLDDKFTIYVDQVLRLESADAADKEKVERDKEKEKAPAAVVAAKPLPGKAPADGAAKIADAKGAKGAGKNRPSPKPGDAPATDAKPAATVAKTAPSVSSPVQAVPKSGSLRWSWPVSGQLLKRFSSDGVGSKGIDIAGMRGDPVKAAADGVVVYSGEGLVGYGKLIILRHNDEYITAYAHNDKLIAAEGQKVKQGQTIAELGSTGAERDKLHFEIRYQGKPVDPLGLLPAN